jgi:PAT family beta-lactamase induction signal transducer AmpG
VTYAISKKNWLLFGSLYTTQYIGIGFIGIALIAILRQEGASLSQLGLIQLMSIPAALKFLWVPFIDRHWKTQRGHYRNWLLFAQICMVASLIIASLMNPVEQLRSMLIVLLIFAFLTATQDLALDGLACRVFQPQHRHQISSIQVGCGLAGNIIGGGLVLLLYPKLGWQLCMLVLGILTSFSWIQLWFFNENAAITSPLPAITTNSWKVLWSVWRGKKRWLLLLMVYPFGFMPIFALLTPVLVDAGWTLPNIGIALKIFGSIVGIVSILVFIPLFKQRSRRTNLVWASTCHAISLLALLPPYWGYTSQPVVYFAVFAYFAGLPLLYSALFAIMMDNAARSHAPATAYTIQNAIPMLLAFISASVGMMLADKYGYSSIAMFSVTCAFVAALLSRFVLTYEEQPDAS